MDQEQTRKVSILEIIKILGIWVIGLGIFYLSLTIQDATKDKVIQVRVTDTIQIENDVFEELDVNIVEPIQIEDPIEIESY